MKTILFYITLFCLLSYSCIKSKKPIITEEIINKLPYYINIEKAFDQYSSVPLSKISNRIEYISLETTGNCLLRKVDKIMLSDSFIFISDFERLYKFDRKGKFLRQIGEPGRGPGEYVYVLHFCIDEMQKRIYIHDFIERFQVFDFDGNFLRSFKMTYSSFNFFCNDSDEIICNVPNSPKDVQPEEISVYIMDNNGEIKNVFKNFHKRVNRFAIPKSPLYKFDNRIRFKEHCVDTLYTLDNNKMLPYAIFNLGDEAMECDPPSNTPQDEDKINSKIRISDIGETNEYILISVVNGLHKEPTMNFIYNKRLQITASLDDNEFVNDLEGLPFWPKFGFYHDDQLLIDFTYAYDFKEKVSSNSINHGPLKDIADKLEENSNPVITIVYLK